MSADLPTSDALPVAELGRRAKAASRVLATASSAAKDDALRGAADLLVARSNEILEANATDVARAESGGVSATVVDRLRLTDARIESMAGGLRQVAGAPRPGGRGARRLGAAQRPAHPPGAGAARRRRHHLREPAERDLRRRRPLPEVGQRRLPAGLVAARSAPTWPSPPSYGRRWPRPGLPADAVILVDDTSREAAVEFMRLRESIDCLIPRGGPSLIRSILDNATVPYVIDGDGNCHVYVDADADLDMALDIVVNAKTQRPSVCNAAETLLVHESRGRRVPAPGRRGPRRCRAARRRAHLRAGAGHRPPTRRPGRRSSSTCAWR